MKAQAETVLIVEDDAGVAELQARRLVRAGYCVCQAGTAEQARARVAEGGIDLIVLDYRLPGEGTGVDVYRQLKEAGYDLPVVMVTGYSQESVAIQALRAGVRDFVSKSAEYLDYLPEAVARVLAQVRTERQLRESEERFHAFMKNSPAVAFIKDAAGRMLYANDSFERRFQLPREQWLNKRDDELWPPETARQLQANDLRVLTEDRTSQLVETVPGPDGVTTHWLVYKFPLPDARGQRLLAGMAIDITDRHQAEQSLKRVEEQLRHAQKMEAVGRLAGGVAHDFNNLLTVIIGCSDLLLEEVRAEDPMQHILEEIRDAGRRAATLTRQLLTFSRRAPVQTRLLNLNDVIQNLQKMLHRLIGEDIELQSDLDPNIANVLSDAGQLEQVIMNLAVNARDAMPTGGTLTIATREVFLDEALCQRHFDMKPGRHVQLTVTDNGCGMDGDTLARIFEPFFTTKAAGRGTGLGLATVYGIVKQAAGDVEVTSTPGTGTTFSIYLPATEAESVADEPGEAGRMRTAGGSEQILLVEDQPELRALVRRQLERGGYAVLEAGNADEALRLESQYPEQIDLLLTDIVMPRMSGTVLAQRLAERRPGIPVLFMTGYAGGQHDACAGDSVLRKPFTQSELLAAVREALPLRKVGSRQ